MNRKLDKIVQNSATGNLDKGKIDDLNCLPETSQLQNLTQ